MNKFEGAFKIYVCLKKFHFFIKMLSVFFLRACNCVLYLISLTFYWCCIIYLMEQKHISRKRYRDLQHIKA